jgi:hypothetical protein
MAGSANALVAGLGQAGTAIFNGANFVSGTLGAMGDAITQGVSNVAKGNFGAAGDAFMSNMKSAFTGEAGSLRAAEQALGARATASLDTFGPAVGPGAAQTEALKVSLQDPALTAATQEFGPAVGPGAADIGQAQEALGLPNTVATSTPGLLEKTKEAVGRAKKVTKAFKGATGGGEGTFTPTLDPLTADTQRISDPGFAKPIQASGGSDLFQQLINQASGQTRGSFA